MHANITELMVSNCDVLTGYHTYPHVDMDSTAVRGANAFFAMLRGETKPVLRWGNAPMLPHVMRQGTDDEPNRSLQARAIELEQSGSLGVSVFTGFPHADIYDAGFSVVAMTDDHADSAQAQVNEILSHAWEQRDAFVYEIEALPASITEEGDKLVIEMSVSSPVFLERLLLRLGSDAQVTAGEPFQSLASTAAKRLLSRYEQL